MALTSIPDEPEGGDEGGPELIVMQPWPPRTARQPPLAKRKPRGSPFRACGLAAANFSPTVSVLDWNQQMTEGYGDFLGGIPKTWLVQDPSKADLVVAGCFTRPEMGEGHLKRPLRSHSKPYIVWTLGLHYSNNCSTHNLCPELVSLLERHDFMFADMELRGYELGSDNADPLPGVTMAPPRGLGPRFFVDLERPPKYFITFRGTMNMGVYGSSTVRQDLRDSFLNNTRSDVIVQVDNVGQPHAQSPDYWELLDSAFVLQPHGHGRWSYRLSETVRFCSIPVLMADGLTLPFEELIDWSDLVVVLPEALAKNPEELLASLPTDPDWIKERRRRICEVRDRHFLTQGDRSEALLRSFAVRSGAAAGEGCAS